MGSVAPRPAYAYDTLEEAFPRITPPIMPCGDKLTVQIRTPKNKSKGGIIFTEQTRETELWNEQTARVVAIGPLCFCNRNTLEPWKEGSWCKIGDFVRIPLYGGDRLAVPIPGSEELALFVTIRDTEIIAKIVGNPLDIRAYT